MRRFIFILLFLTGALDLRATGAPTSAEESLMRRALTLYQAHRDAIRTVDCQYTETINEVPRRCEYVKNGDKFYHASMITSADGGLSLPFVAVWNGVKGFTRPHLN